MRDGFGVGFCGFFAGWIFCGADGGGYGAFLTVDLGSDFGLIFGQKFSGGFRGGFPVDLMWIVLRVFSMCFVVF